jgi:hypothetical protein
MSLRSAMAEHFGNLERMQGGGTVNVLGKEIPVSGGGGSTEQGLTGDYAGWVKFIKNPGTSLSALQQNLGIFTKFLDRWKNGTYYEGGTWHEPPRSGLTYDQVKTLTQLAYGQVVNRTNPKVSPPSFAGAGGEGSTSGGASTGGASTGGAKKYSLVSAIQNMLGGKAPQLVTDLTGAGNDTTLADALAALSGAGGDTYHSPEWRPGELELSQRAQAETEATDRATLAQNTAQLEQAEQSSRRDALLTAAQALFAAAGTAAPPGMTTYPGFEPGGIAEQAAKVSGNTVPTSLQAPITRKPVSFDVLNAFDLGPLKEQIAAIMGLSGAKKGLVSMADGGSTYMDDIARYKAGIAGKTPEEIAMINRYLAGLGGGTGTTSAGSLDAILGQAIYDSWLQNQLQQEQLTGATIPNVRNTIAQTMGYNDTGQPTLDMRQLLADTAANPRDIIKGLFLGRGLGLPADLSNVAAANLSSVSPSGGTSTSGSAAAAGPVGVVGGNTRVTQGETIYPKVPWVSPTGTTWRSEQDYTRQMQRNANQRANNADALARARAGDYSGYAGFNRSAEGKVVSGPAISTVGERGGDAGTEYAYLPPGAVVAPKPAGEKPSMDGAIRAIAAQLFKSGLGGGVSGMATGGSVFSPTVTGSLPRSLLDAPALQAFMNPTNAGLPSVHKMPALFQPFGEGGPEAPNWLDPRTTLAYAHADPTEQATMESLTSAFGWDPATALEMGRRAMAGFGKPITGQATYRPYWSWG